MMNFTLLMRAALALVVVLALVSADEPSSGTSASDQQRCSVPMHLPVIDAADLTASGKEILAATLPKDGGSGVFYLKNCGFLCDIMSSSSWEKVYDVYLEEFFAKGREDEGATAGGDSSRGFIRKGGESGVVGKFYEVKEGFEYGLEGAGSRPNKWGGTSDEMTAKLMKIFDEMQSLKNAIVEAVLAPYLNDGGVDGGVELLTARDWEGGKEIDLIRIFNYLPCEAGSEGEGDLPSLGSSPHTDWGVLTIILQPPSSPTALQVLSGEKEWVDVPPIENTVVVNVGDFAELLSHVNHREPGETFTSPIHRVQHCSRGARKGFVFFSYPRHDYEIPKDVVERVKEGKGGGGFNTLLGDDTGASQKTFGGWIDEKWRGVKA